MQCVILCAGKGTRMRPLTENTPKPLLSVCGKPILDHIVEALPPEVDSLVLVVGYLKEQIIAHCGEEFFGRSVTYVKQADLAGGTGDALLCAKDVVQGKFLFLNGDDIYGAPALQKIVHEDSAMFGVHSDTPELFGVLTLHENGTLKEIVEKPENPPSNLINIGGYVLSDAIFEYQTAVSHLGEVLVTDMVTDYAKDYPVAVVEQDLWLPIGYPEHIEAAEAVLCPQE